MKNRLKLIFGLISLSLLISVVDFLGGSLGSVPIIGGLLVGATNSVLEVLQGMLNVVILILLGRFIK